MAMLEILIVLILANIQALMMVADGQGNDDEYLQPVHVRIGSVDAHLLVDGGVFRSCSVFGKDPAEWEDKEDSNGDPYVDDDCYFVDYWLYSAVVVVSEGKVVLSDTALGEVAPSSGSDIYSPRLPFLLAQIGLTVEDIDVVIHSHLHRDHTGYDVVFDNIQDDNNKKNDMEMIATINSMRRQQEETRVHFPNAIHIMQQAEKDYWLSTDDLRASCNWDVILAPVEEAGQLLTVVGEYHLTSEVRLLPCIGHTGGSHQCLYIDSNNSHGIYIGDSFHHTVQIQVPDWAPTFDFNTTLSTQTRREIIDFAFHNNAYLLSPHFSYPGIGHVRINFEHPDDESGYIFEHLQL